MQDAQCAVMPEEIVKCFHSVGLSAGFLDRARAERSDVGRVDEEGDAFG